MTEPTKEQVEKWKQEFEDDKNLWPSHPMDYGDVIKINLFNKGNDGEYSWGETRLKWKCYLAAKKSNFEEIESLRAQRYEYYAKSEQLKIEIKTLKEQLAEFVKLAKLGVYSVDGLLTHNHESWELSAESWLLKTKTLIEKQEKENKDKK